jgi:hypothetical protein
MTYNFVDNLEGLIAESDGGQRQIAVGGRVWFSFGVTQLSVYY